MFLLQQIRQTALASPDKLAVVTNGQPVSYGRFWRLIAGSRRTLAPLLPVRGVALLAVRGIFESWILDLALRGLGHDTAIIRSADQGALFEGLDVACVVTLRSETWPAISGLARARRLSLEPPSDQPVSDADALPAAPRGPCGGHILLTSGTTGLPKKVLTRIGGTREDSAIFGDGVVQMWAATVRNVFNLGLWTGAGYWTPVWTWCGAGAVVLQDGDDLERVFDWPGITHTVATPAYLARLMAMPEGAFPFCPQMVLTIMAGALPPHLAREVRRRLAPLININLSSTEVGGWARVFAASDEDLLWYRIDPSRRVQVVDDAGVSLPNGALGRVRVALPDGAPRGYIADPETSAQFFQDGWFYPGDLGVLDGAGRIALHGRVADVVYLDGDKIATGPWERAIQARLGCEGVCILSGRWRSEDEQLHVFVESARMISLAELTAAVRDTVSGFKAVQVHKVDTLPRGELGKIRRIDLAQRLHDGAFDEAALTP
jgi:acyl-coenzyme A synthetase/AMP-(fatty) acid ligase